MAFDQALLFPESAKVLLFTSVHLQTLLANGVV